MILGALVIPCKAQMFFDTRDSLNGKPVETWFEEINPDTVSFFTRLGDPFAVEFDTLKQMMPEQLIPSDQWNLLYGYCYGVQGVLSQSQPHWWYNYQQSNDTKTIFSGSDILEIFRTDSIFVADSIISQSLDVQHSKGFQSVHFYLWNDYLFVHEQMDRSWEPMYQSTVDRWYYFRREQM